MRLSGLIGSACAGLAMLLASNSLLAQRPPRQDPIRERVAAIMKRLDANTDGAIDQREAGQTWARISAADRDRDGKVTTRELYAFLSKSGRGR